MAIKTLICGLSGTGKSRSMKSFSTEGVKVAVVNPVNKPLPFRNDFEMLNGETDSRKILKFMRETDAKVIVVDDFQYLLAIPYMRRVKENGWDKYNDFAANYFDVIQVCDELPADKTVYFMTHTETLEDGQETVKLIGKLLREKICIEGLFTIVLKTLVSDGKYYFTTQNSGKDNVKSPEDMFPSYAIDNDLKYVDDKIRNYYHVGEFLTDEEMAEIDEEAKKVDVIKEDGKRRGRRNAKKEESENTPAEETKEAGTEEKRSRKRKISSDESTSDGQVSESGVKTREEVEKENSAAVVNAGLKEAGNAEEVEFDKVETPEVKTPPRRTRKDRTAAVMPEPEEPKTEEQETAASTERRRRRRG